MNRNFAVKILLILAIVLQSFNAVSALLDAHQVDAQHLETVHDHASDTKIVAENQVTDVGDDDHNINDCHHCGHCSGSHFSWVLVKAYSPNIAFVNSGKILKEGASPFRTSGFIYRPPIA